MFEHPRWVDSWWEGAVQRVRELENVHVVHTDQCMFGLCDPPNRKRYRKPTTWSWPIRNMDMCCIGGVMENMSINASKGWFVSGDGGRIGRHVHRFTPNSWLNSLWDWSGVKRNSNMFMRFTRQERFLGNMNMSMTVVLVNLGTTRAWNSPPCQHTKMSCERPSRERFIHMLKPANASEESPLKLQGRRRYVPGFTT